ncbi:MAG: metallophosphoesterase [Bacteroidota bacterium]
MYYRLLFLLFLPLVTLGQMAPEILPEVESMIDGPYLIYEGDELKARWAYPEKRTSDELIWSEENIHNLPEFPGFHPASVQPDAVFRRDPQVSFSGVQKIVAMSDIHGQYEVARALLYKHGVIDEDAHWTFGKGHLVIVGDVFDRGDQVNATLWMIHNLQKEAATAGGRVHFLLGNHETMILEGDIRYLNKRYLTTTALLSTPYQNLYGPNTYLGRWLRSLPLTIRINDHVFVHGGLSKDLLKEVPSLKKINDLYHSELIDAEPMVATADSPKADLLYGRNGPLWYRGYFLETDFEERDIDRILKRVKAERLVVGHTSFDAIKSYFNGKVLAVDSSIKFGSTGEILLIEDGEYLRGDVYGKRLPLFE